MTAQEKAEQYVRSKCPELMELSFGCEIVVAGIAKDNPGCERDVVLYGTQEQWDKGFIPTEYYGQVPRDEIEQIIGHPIQLQHWLRVLQGKSFRTLTQREEHFKGEAVPDDHLLVWHETGKQVYFILTTGQPKDEADYQAFLDIVEI